MTATAAPVGPRSAAGASGTTTNPSRWLVVAFFGLFALYAVTARWSPPYFVDAYTNVLQAHSMADTGSPVLEDADELLEDKYRGELVWVVESVHGPASQYPPGVGIWAAPFYLFDTSVEDVTATFDNEGTPERVDLRVPSFAPAAIAAALSAALAMLFFGLTLSNVVSRRTAQVAVGVAALGTGTWAIAANMLWQHGPAMMCIAAGTFFASRDRFKASGVAFAAALLIRPHTAVIAAGIGLVAAWRRRSVRPLLELGIPGALCVVGLVIYNDWLWGTPGISGGYGGTFSNRVANTPVWVVGERLIESVFHPTYGMAATSPVLLLCFMALVARRRDAPDWAVGAALGGLVYLLIQYKANRVSGGGGFFGYRYPLEALMAAAPMMAITLRSWIGDDRFRLRIFGVLAGVSIVFQAYGAITT